MVVCIALLLCLTYCSRPSSSVISDLLIFRPIKVSYFKFCNFLLGFPLSFSNTEIVLKLKVKDPVVCIKKKKYKTFEDKAKIILLGHNLFPFFSNSSGS